MVSGRPMPFDEPHAEPAEHGGAGAVGMGEREEGRVPRAHGIAHDVGALEAEMLDQAADVLGHDRGVIGGGIVELARLAVAAIVERDDAPAGARERRHPAGRDPVHFLVRREAVDEHDRLALPFVEKRNFHAVTNKARHTVCPLRIFLVGLNVAARHYHSIGRRQSMVTARQIG